MPAVNGGWRCFSTNQSQPNLGTFLKTAAILKSNWATLWHFTCEYLSSYSGFLVLFCLFVFNHQTQTLLPFQPGVSDLSPRWVRLAPNASQNIVKSDVLKSDFPVKCQSDSLWAQIWHPWFQLGNRGCQIWAQSGSDCLVWFHSDPLYA